MSSPTLLNDFIMANRDEIVLRARLKGGVRSMLRLTDAKLDEGIPLFLDRLDATLKSISEGDVASTDAAEYGADLYRMGFTVAQVVYGYGDVCQAVTEVALEKTHRSAWMISGDTHRHRRLDRRHGDRGSARSRGSWRYLLGLLRAQLDRRR